VLIFKRNRTKTYAVLEFDKLLELLKWEIPGKKLWLM
jgi:hypothetical protein